MDVSGIMGYVMLGMLGILLLVVILGVFWGMIRGTKRSLLRLGTIVIFFTIALLITPVVTRGLAKIELPFFDGMNSIEYGKSVLAESSTGQNVLGMTEIVSFIEQFILVIANMIVFVLLLLILKPMSWILYAILAIILFPKKKDGEKIKVNKLGGIGIGFAQALVMFFFFMIPVNCLFYNLNKIDKYEPALTTVPVTQMNIGELNDLNIAINDANTSARWSVAGVISRFTGMQLLSNASMKYLTKIELEGSGKKIDLIENTVKAFEILRDAVAVEYRFSAMNSPKDMCTLDKEFQELRSIADKCFSLDIINLMLDADIASFIENEGILFLDTDESRDGVKFFTNPDDEAKENELNARFNRALLGALKSLGSAFLKEDAKTAIDLAEILFRTEEINESTGRKSYNLFITASAFVDNINGEKSEECSADFIKAMQVKINNERNIDRLMKKLVSFNIFQKFLGENPDLINVPVEVFLGVEIEEIKSFNWDSIATTTSDLVIDSVNVASKVFSVMEGDIVKNISDMDDEEFKNLAMSVGGILDTLTNIEVLKPLIKSGLDMVIGDFLSEEEENSIGEPIEPGVPQGENGMIGLDDFSGEFVTDILKKIARKYVDKITGEYNDPTWNGWGEEIIKLRGIVKDAFGLFESLNSLIEKIQSFPDQFTEFETMFNNFQNLIDRYGDGTDPTVFQDVNELVAMINELDSAINTVSSNIATVETFLSELAGLIDDATRIIENIEELIDGEPVPELSSIKDSLNNAGKMREEMQDIIDDLDFETQLGSLQMQLNILKTIANHLGANPPYDILP